MKIEASDRDSGDYDRPGDVEVTESEFPAVVPSSVTELVVVDCAAFEVPTTDAPLSAPLATLLLLKPELALVLLCADTRDVVVLFFVGSQIAVNKTTVKSISAK